MIYEWSNTAEIFPVNLMGLIHKELEPLTEVAHTMCHVTERMDTTVGMQMHEHFVFDNCLRHSNMVNWNCLFFKQRPDLTRQFELAWSMKPYAWTIMGQLSLVTSCAGLQEEEPQTAHLMSVTWASHIAASVLTGH